MFCLWFLLKKQKPLSLSIPETHCYSLEITPDWILVQTSVHPFKEWMSFVEPELLCCSYPAQITL